ncbi:MAG: hypothetical protein AB7G40_13130 [Hyphomonadaceae bacterium]
MSGWRDEEGRTAADRKSRAQAQERARFLETARNRPLSLVKPAIGALFIGVLVFALVAAYG